MLIFSLVCYLSHLFNAHDRVAVRWPLMSEPSASNEAVFTLSLLSTEVRNCFARGPSVLFFFLPFSILFALLVDLIAAVTILVKRHHRHMFLLL